MLVSHGHFVVLKSTGDDDLDHDYRLQFTNGTTLCAFELSP